MNRKTLSAIAEQHLALIRPSSRTYADDVTQNRAQFNYRKNLLVDFVEFWSAKVAFGQLNRYWLSIGFFKERIVRNRFVIGIDCNHLQIALAPSDDRNDNGSSGPSIPEITTA